MKPGISILFVILCCTELTAEEIRVDSGGVQLAGELLLPEVSACVRCPLVILVQGSGSSDRSNPWTAAWAEGLLQQDVAVLHTDKRGSGASGGDWRKVDLDQLAEDAAEFVSAVAGHQRIDDSRIGVMGFSQGGHVVSVLADVNNDVDFVVSLSASVVPLGEQILDEVLLQGREDGLTEEQLSKLPPIHFAAMKYVDGEVAFDDVEEALNEASDAGLEEYGFVTEFPRPEVEWLWPWLSLVKDFNPMPYWMNAEKPVLFIFGGQDLNVDVSKSVERIRANIMSKGNPTNLLVHDENGHALFRKDTVAFVAEFARRGGRDD